MHPDKNLCLKTDRRIDQIIRRTEGMDPDLRMILALTPLPDNPCSFRKIGSVIITDGKT